MAVVRKGGRAAATAALSALLAVRPDRVPPAMLRRIELATGLLEAGVTDPRIIKEKVGGTVDELISMLWQINQRRA